MTIWLDEQISPLLASWIQTEFAVQCKSVVDLPVDRGSDLDIFLSVRQANAVIVSKDSDFADLVQRLGTPPSLLWITSGNRSNNAMKLLLLEHLSQALVLLADGESVVEIA